MNGITERVICGTTGIIWNDMPGIEMHGGGKSFFRAKERKLTAKEIKMFFFSQFLIFYLFIKEYECA